MRRTWLPVLLLGAASPLLIGSTGLRSNFNERVLAAHNRERDILNVPALQWSDELARDARVWAEELGRSGRFEHSADDPGTEPQGENLWAGSAGFYSPEAMVGLWAAEKRHFRPGVFPHNSRTGRVQDVSHYTQLVWSESRAVGCALGRSKTEDVLVCRYSRSGNVIGLRPF